jgi:hypothetical protein
LHPVGEKQRKAGDQNGAAVRHIVFFSSFANDDASNARSTT